MISVPDLVNSQLQTKLLGEHPFRFIPIFIHTLQRNIDPYLQQGIGNFGWIDTPLPWIVVIFVILFLAMCFWKAVHEGKTNASLFVAFVCILFPIVNIVGIFFTMYKIATPVGSPEIDSIQGRYFFPFLPFFLYGLYVLFIRWKRWSTILILCCGAGIVVLSTASVIFQRYYDYSQVFIDPNRLLVRVETQQINIVRDLYVSVNKIFTVPIEVKSRYKLAGFQIIVRDPGGEFPMTVPYRFRIKDGGGSVVREGFLNLMDIQYPGVRTQTFYPVQISDSHITVDLIPLSTVSDGRYLELISDGTLPLIHPLYLSQ